MIFALGAPLLGAFLFAGPPSALTVDALDSWSPIRTPGPSTSLLAQGITALAGIDEGSIPEWFDAENQALLRKASNALEADKLKEALGHVFTLSAQLEDKGKTLNDFLPLVMPELSSWIVANYFGPVLLGTLIVALILLIFGPWLVKRFYDFLKLISTLVLGMIGIAFAASLCFAIAKQKALVFGLIEYLVVAAALLSAGNLILLWNDRRRRKAIAKPLQQAIAAGKDKDKDKDAKRPPVVALVAKRDPVQPRLDLQLRGAVKALSDGGSAEPVESVSGKASPLVAPVRSPG